MGKLETLTVDVPEDLATAIRAAVERGEFESLSEAVTAGLIDLLYDPSQETPEQTERLRRAVEEGIASGPGREVSGEELLAEIKRRHADRAR
jgi:antitoxin ParD1/3/4